MGVAKPAVRALPPESRAVSVARPTTTLSDALPAAMAEGDALCGTIELEPGSNPGERRTLNVYFNYDVVKGGKEGDGLVEPDDRERFQRWTVQ